MELHPFDAPCAWRGPELARTPERWIHRLSPAELDDLARALDATEGRALASLRATDLPEGPLTEAIRGWRRALERGLGLVLVRGVPVEALGEERAARAYWLLGLHLGTPVPQNFAGELLTHVRDTGADPTDPRVRLYTTRAEQDFHTDGADVIGLLCLRGARRGGLSRIVSSVSVFNRLLATHRELVPLLLEPWAFHLHGPRVEGIPSHFEMPICRVTRGHLATFFIGWYIRRAQELPEVAPLGPAREALLAAYEATANDPDLWLDMAFEPGDIQWLKNSVILHKRTAYEDWPEPARRRHLLRLWLTARDFEDGDERLRRGVDPDALPR